jgi:hypothetical protein
MAEELSLYKIVNDSTHASTIEVLQLDGKELSPPLGKYWVFELTESGLVIIDAYEYVYFTNGAMKFDVESTKNSTTVMHPASHRISVVYLDNIARRKRIKEHLHQITKEHNSNS